jgi:tetratricopeptide (TPR) repeat protein
MISNETLDTMMSVGGGIANLLIILLIVCAVFFGIILIFMIIWALVSWYLAVRRGVAERKDAIDERVLQLEQENSEFTTTLQYFRDLNLKIDVLMERTNYFQETVTKLLVEGNQVRYVEMPKEEEPEIQVLSVDEDDDEVKGPAIQTVSLDEDDDEVKGPAIQTVSLDEDKPSNISRSNDDIQLNALLSEGRSCIREYRYIEAIDLFTKIIEINPSLSQAYNFRGIARRKLGELDLAIEDYNLALNINENYVEVLNNRGVALDKKGDHDSAISDFTKAINIDASNPHTYNNRATAYTNKGDYNMTLVDCTRAIQEDNKMADAYVNRGVAKVLLGLNEDAETDFEIAVSFGYDRSIVDSKIADLKNKNV